MDTRIKENEKILSLEALKADHQQAKINGVLKEIEILKNRLNSLIATLEILKGDDDGT